MVFASLNAREPAKKCLILWTSNPSNTGCNCTESKYVGHVKQDGRGDG